MPLLLVATASAAATLRCLVRPSVTPAAVLGCCRRRFLSAQPQQQQQQKPLHPAAVDGRPPNETSSPVVRDLADRICQLSLLEVAELSRHLQAQLGVSALPSLPPDALKAFMSGAGAGGSGSDASDASGGKAEPAAAQVAVKTSFNLKLVKFDAAKKVALIKELKARNPTLNLVQTKKLVESAPAVVVNDLTRDEAEAMKAALEQMGASIEIE